MLKWHPTGRDFMKSFKASYDRMWVSQHTPNPSVEKVMGDHCGLTKESFYTWTWRILPIIEPLRSIRKMNSTSRKSSNTNFGTMVQATAGRTPKIDQSARLLRWGRWYRVTLPVLTTLPESSVRVSMTALGSCIDLLVISTTKSPTSERK